MELFKAIITLLAGLGSLMVGMKMLSEGLERSAGGGMRKLFGKISNNRFAGIGVGAVATILVNSSAATTVMVIGFVNAGLMTLLQATSIIMGANIGTTLTGVIIALSGFDFGGYMALLAFVGVVLIMFSKNDTIRKIGSAIAGLGLMFLGLSTMSTSFKTSATLSRALRTTFVKVDFPLLLIFIGMVCTALFQSSAAMTALVVTMAAPTVIGGVTGAPIIPLQSALFVILGTNIGTCVTALLASLGASTNAKRTAMIHLLFNTIGTVIFTTFIWIFKAQTVKLFGMLTSSTQMQVALFHVFFNVITTILLVPFMKPLTKLATLLVREHQDDDTLPHMYYIDDRILQTPPIAVAQSLKEVSNMATLAADNLERGFNAIVTGSLAEKEKIHIEEEKINFLNKGITRYLIKMSSLNLRADDDKLVGSLHHVIGDLERIGDHAENFFEVAEEMKQNGCVFSEEAIADLEFMYGRVKTMFDRAIYVFINRDADALGEVSAIEDEIDELQRSLGNNHIARLNRGNCSIESGTHFYAIITALERVADHLVNVAFSIKSPSGSQREAMEVISGEQKHHPARN